MDLAIDIDTFKELLQIRGADGFLKLAEEAIASGGVVTFEVRYVNAPTELNMLIRTKEELAQFRERLERATTSESKA